MDKKELYNMKDELLNLKAQELEKIENHNEYAMRANEQRDFMEKQMKREAMRADEESEARFRKMMQMGKEKENIERLKNIPKEEFAKKAIIKPLKIESPVVIKGSGMRIVEPPVGELEIREENHKTR